MLSNRRKVPRVTPTAHNRVRNKIQKVTPSADDSMRNKNSKSNTKCC
jgi:hypothetical protein